MRKHKNSLLKFFSLFKSVNENIFAETQQTLIARKRVIKKVLIMNIWRSNFLRREEKKNKIALSARSNDEREAG